MKTAKQLRAGLVGEGEFIPNPDDREPAKIAMREAVISDLLSLVHKWRASANKNISRALGYKARDRHKAIQALAMAGGLRICAADLEMALASVVNTPNP